MSKSDRGYQNLEEPQRRDDDFEIEMVDLDTLSEESAAKPADEGEKQDGDDTTVVVQPAPVRVSLRSRLTQRQRWLRITGLVIAVIVALVLIVNSIAPAHTLLGLLAGPTPTPTAGLTAGDDHFYLDASPPWGKLTLDGEPLMFSSVEPIQLPRGLHHFVWQASPFQTIRCTLSVPVTRTDTCKHITIAVPSDGTNNAAQEVTFYDTLAMLPLAQQMALTRVAQVALDAVQSTAMVQPGERFIHIVGKRTTDVATVQLRARLHFDLSVGDPEIENAICANDYSSECFFLHRYQLQDVTQNCDWFCTNPDTYLPVTVPNYWQAVVIAREYWDFSTLDGHVIAANQPDTELDLSGSAHFIFLNITWDGAHWQATLNTQEENGYNQLACLAASNEFSEIPPPVGINGFGFSVTATAVPAIGCLEVVQSTAASPSASIPNTAPPAFCLYRFGVLLAANALAHRYWPSLPLATPYEQVLAKQMAPVQN